MVMERGCFKRGYLRQKGASFNPLAPLGAHAEGKRKVPQPHTPSASRAAG